jgi:zinc metalloprotease ZmpB
MTFELTPEVEVHRDENGQVTQLRHTRRRYSNQEARSANPTPAEIAEQYVRDVAGIYGIKADETTSLREAMPSDPVAETVKLRLLEEKNIIDTTTVVTFQQTAYGLPVWNSNLSVVVAGESPAVVSSRSSLHHDIDIDLGTLSIERLTGFAQATPTSLQDAIGVDDSAGAGFALNGVRLLVYRYDPAERIDPEARPADAGGYSAPQTGDSSPAASSEQADAGYDPDNPRQPGIETPSPMQSGASDVDAGFAPEGPAPEMPPADGEPLQKGPPTLPLPPVPPSIVPGRHYVVQEVLFRLAVPGEPELNWRAFVEPESRAVLYLRALTSSATCAVFETDPIAKTGVVITAASAPATLDAARTLGLTVQNLNAPVAGSQALSGTYARVADTNPPAIPPPTTVTPFQFEYPATSDNFSASNAYYHTDWMYQLVKGMGFNLATYFNGTAFPVPVDHMGEGISVNARAEGNAAGNGMGRFRYGICQSGQTMGIATQVGVCLHEFGHALLWDHVNSPNFGWCHSAGDTLAALMMDPESKAPDRFATFPFVSAGTPGIDRRHDRSIAAGWAWGGTRDDRQYGSEQILSTTLFRVYRVTGGDDADINVKKFAARYLTYLILRAIGTLTATTTDPRGFVTALQDADDLTMDFEGHAGGAWHKVIRWSFEKQGLFQLPGAPTPVTQPGAPPDVDVFINDGRNGEYEPYLTNLGASPGVWNRLASDGGTTNQEPAAGMTNYLYVRVGNRGRLQAQGVSVKCYQRKAGSGVNWPADWTPLTTASLAGPAIAAGGNAVIGPFQWTPTQSGPISVLASVSATGDASNADTVNGSISNRRLVPNDNNLAQRDLTASGAVGGGISIKICSGSTTAGSTNWQPYGGNTGIYLDIDTSACKFTTTPRYFASLGGNSSHWATTGATSIYSPTPNGFRVYVRWSDGSALTPAQANSFQWHINWLAVEE